MLPPRGEVGGNEDTQEDGGVVVTEASWRVGEGRREAQGGDHKVVGTREASVVSAGREAKEEAGCAVGGDGRAVNDTGGQEAGEREGGKEGDEGEGGGSMVAGDGGMERRSVRREHAEMESRELPAGAVSAEDVGAAQREEGSVAGEERGNGLADGTVAEMEVNPVDGVVPPKHEKRGAKAVLTLEPPSPASKRAKGASASPQAAGGGRGRGRAAPSRGGSRGGGVQQQSLKKFFTAAR